MNKYTFVYLSTLLLIFSSCSKNKITLPFKVLQQDKEYNLYSVHFNNANEGHVVGGKTWFEGTYLSTNNAGEDWTEAILGDKQLNGLNFQSEGYGVCVGIDGYLYEKDDPNAEWRYHRLRHWHFLRDIAIESQNEMLAVGGQAYKNGAIYHMDQPWRVDSIFRIEQELSAVTYVGENRAVAVGYGVVLLSKDKGYNWEILPIQGDFFQDVQFVSDQVGFILGFAGTVLKTNDAGSTWQKIRNARPAGNNVLRAMAFKDENLGFLVGDNGRFFKTEDGGDSWLLIEDMPVYNFNDIFLIENKGYIVGESGIIIQFDI
jgi:photosystem II stability/assembly factor-like uncharacterized protein